ncbi:hypothetical protein EYF80_043965 [Liparis tanakae]|uniref:Uncharacterized protein n=1 Tax=Liparis tanakae TaxID=230148 RepID=A0A4Z2FY80_9TELE|nr:hypothetical protein EYF80_043965 [Liparis tanakae]
MAQSDQPRHRLAELPQQRDPSAVITASVGMRNECATTAARIRYSELKSEPRGGRRPLLSGENNYSRNKKNGGTAWLMFNSPLTPLGLPACSATLPSGGRSVSRRPWRKPSKTLQTVIKPPESSCENENSNWCREWI